MRYLLLLLLSGCTMYTVEKTATDGSTIRVTVQSTRSFEQPNLHYQRTGNDAVFDFTAANADNNAVLLAQMVALLQQMTVK